MEDSYIINKIRSGNYAAFNLLITRYESYVYSILTKILKVRQDAEEAFQDTFLKVYKNLDQYDDTAKFSSWLYRIAYNTALDYTRKNKRKTQDIDNIKSTTIAELQDNHIEKDELNNALEKLLDQLPDDEATLLKLYYLKEMNIKELCQIMSWTESNVKTKLFRARKKLQDLIGEDVRNELKSYYHE